MTTTDGELLASGYLLAFQATDELKCLVRRAHNDEMGIPKHQAREVLESSVKHLEGALCHIRELASRAAGVPPPKEGP